MPDVFTKKKRSEVMSRIRSRGNRDTEIVLMRLLRANQITGWRRHLQIHGRDAGRARHSVRADGGQRTARPTVLVFDRILFSGRPASPCSWTAVSGTAVRATPICPSATARSGAKNSPPTAPATASSIAGCGNSAGASSDSGNINCGIIKRCLDEFGAAWLRNHWPTTDDQDFAWSRQRYFLVGQPLSNQGWQNGDDKKCGMQSAASFAKRLRRLKECGIGGSGAATDWMHATVADRRYNRICPGTDASNWALSHVASLLVSRGVPRDKWLISRHSVIFRVLADGHPWRRAGGRRRSCFGSAGASPYRFGCCAVERWSKKGGVS